MLSRRALSDVWSGGAGAGGAGAARTEHFLHIGQALKLDAVLRGDAPTSLVSSGNHKLENISTISIHNYTCIFFN